MSKVLRWLLLLFGKRSLARSLAEVSYHKPIHRLVSFGSSCPIFQDAVHHHILQSCIRSTLLKQIILQMLVLSKQHFVEWIATMMIFLPCFSYFLWFFHSFFVKPCDYMVLNLRKWCLPATDFTGSDPPNWVVTPKWSALYLLCFKVNRAGCEV